MNQYKFLHDCIKRHFLNLRLYQVSVETIEDLTGLWFAALQQVQPQPIIEAIIAPERVEPESWSIISTPEDVVL